MWPKWQIGTTGGNVSIEYIRDTLMGTCEDDWCLFYASLTINDKCHYYYGSKRREKNIITSLFCESYDFGLVLKKLGITYSDLHDYFHRFGKKDIPIIHLAYLYTSISSLIRERKIREGKIVSSRWYLHELRVRIDVF